MVSLPKLELEKRWAEIERELIAKGNSPVRLAQLKEMFYLGASQTVRALTVEFEREIREVLPGSDI